MKRKYPIIDMVRTGQNIKHIMQRKGMTVKDIQEAMCRFKRLCVSACLYIMKASYSCKQDKRGEEKMIPTLYEPFRRWSDGGSVFILSDLHFDGSDCKLIDPTWISPEEQLAIINSTVAKGDTFVCLGDVGDPKYVPMIKARKKILLLGNHDAKGAYNKLFDEIYTGPLFIADKILLSHEPVYGLPWCLNIHGHDHNNVEKYKEGCKHINLAANVCGYTPINLGKIIKQGVLSDIKNIHRMTIDGAVTRKSVKNSLLN